MNNEQEVTRLLSELERIANRIEVLCRRIGYGEGITNEENWGV